MPITIDEMLEASSTARAFWEEGRQAGLKEVLMEGQAEGRVEGLRLAARLGLEHRFGALDADLLQAIGAADEPMLTAIITQQEESLEQVKARLGLAQPQ